MDNITQGVIGGWIMDKIVGEAPEKTTWWQRNKVFILGGFITNIPDLDVFIGDWIPHKDYMSEFLFHRSMSHSIFFNILVALLVGFICAKTDTHKRPWRRWTLGTYIGIVVGHLLVDRMTSYGGRYLLPFSDATYSFDNIFVIDLFYTLPLIALRLGYIFLKTKAARKFWYIIGAVWIVFYPLFTFFVKQTAESAFTDSLQKQGIAYSRMMSSPEPLQAFLWRGLVKGTTGYHEGYYSIFDKDADITWRFIPDDLEIREAVINLPEVQQVELWANGRTTYAGSGSEYVTISALKQGGTLGRQGTGDTNGGFILNSEGHIIGQGRRGGGRFDSGFSYLWNAHWQRVRGDETESTQPQLCVAGEPGCNDISG